MSTTVLEALRSGGYCPRLYWPVPENPEQHSRPAPRLIVDGDEPLPPELREEVRANRDALKVAVLLSDPPAWLARLFDLYCSGHESPVKLTSPASGKAEVYMVSLSIKNIAAAVAQAIGAGGLEWGKVLPEVEEALGTWEPAKLPAAFLKVGAEEGPPPAQRAQRETPQERRKRLREEREVQAAYDLMVAENRGEDQDEGEGVEWLT